MLRWHERYDTNPFSCILFRHCWYFAKKICTHSWRSKSKCGREKKPGPRSQPFSKWQTKITNYDFQCVWDGAICVCVCVCDLECLECEVLSPNVLAHTHTHTHFIHSQHLTHSRYHHNKITYWLHRFATLLSPLFARKLYFILINRQFLKQIIKIDTSFRLSSVLVFVCSLRFDCWVSADKKCGYIYMFYPPLT